MLVVDRCWLARQYEIYSSTSFCVELACASAVEINIEFTTLHGSKGIWSRPWHRSVAQHLPEKVSPCRAGFHITSRSAVFQSFRLNVNRYASLEYQNQRIPRSCLTGTLMLEVAQRNYWIQDAISCPPELRSRLLPPQALLHMQTSQWESWAVSAFCDIYFFYPLSHPLYLPFRKSIQSLFSHLVDNSL